MTPIAIAVLLLSGFGGYGQDGTQPEALLSGLTSVRIAIDDLSNYATACGVTQDSIRAVVSKHLMEGQVRVEESAPVLFRVKVSTLYIREPEICISNVWDALRTEGSVALPYANTTRKATVILGDDGATLFTSKPSEHALRLATILEIAARRTAGAIKIANQ